MLNDKIKTAIWIGDALYRNGKVTGSTGNLSFRHDDKMYITASGSCFGKLSENDFACVDMKGNIQGDKKPSKEYPLHLDYYNHFEDTGAVIHTHSFYSMLWSCLEHKNIEDIMPEYTPYLSMKVGKVSLVPYGHPGSENLFDKFKRSLNTNKALLLSHHGPVIGHKDLMSAFYALEEFEESAKIAWMLQNHDVKQLNELVK